MFAASTSSTTFRIGVRSPRFSSIANQNGKPITKSPP
jgi:hypothetical protein